MLAAMAQRRRAADSRRAKSGEVAHRRLAHAHLKTQSGPSHSNISATTAPGTIPMCDIVVQLRIHNLYSAADSNFYSMFHVAVLLFDLVERSPYSLHYRLLPTSR